MGIPKKVDRVPQCGIITLYDGEEVIRIAVYNRRSKRDTLLIEWRSDIKKLKPKKQFYLTITPDI